mmetsp:Transcript_25888/g.61413  ORF Transcript_25888/g.61413 Transcript_25888/m.61413 type:complete len:152 (-) Transcript_25888:183-638(-)
MVVRSSHHQSNRIESIVVSCPVLLVVGLYLVYYIWGGGAWWWRYCAMRAMRATAATYTLLLLECVHQRRSYHQSMSISLSMSTSTSIDRSVVSSSTTWSILNRNNETNNDEIKPNDHRTYFFCEEYIEYYRIGRIRNGTTTRRRRRRRTTT